MSNDSDAVVNIKPAEEGSEPTQSSFVQTIGKAIAWGQALSILRLGLSFAYSIVVVRALVPADYGLYAFTYSILITSGLAISLGFDGVIGRYASQFQASKVLDSLSHLLIELVSWRFALLISVGFVLSFFSAEIAGILNNPPAAPYIQLLGFLLFLQNMRLLLNSFHYALLNIRYAETVSIIERSVALGMSLIFFTFIGKNLWSIFGALVISETIALALLVIPTRKYWKKLSHVQSILHDKQIRSMALNYWGMDLITYGLSVQLAVLLISLLLSDNTQIAYYSIGTNLLSQITAVAVSNWKNVPLPALSQVRVSKGDEGVILGWQLFLKLFSFALMPVLFFLLFNSLPLVILLYGEGYAHSAYVMQIGAIFFYIALASGFWSTLGALYTLDAQNSLLRLRVWTGVSNIVLILILIPLFGIWGAAIASPLTSACGNWFEFRLLRRHLAVRIPWRFISLLTLINVVSGFASWLVSDTDWISLLLRGVIFGTVFIALLVICKPLETEEVTLAHKFLPRFRYAINLMSRRQPEHIAHGI